MKQRTETTYELDVDDIKEAIAEYLQRKEGKRVQAENIRFTVSDTNRFDGPSNYELSGASAVVKESTGEPRYAFDTDERYR